MLTQKIQPMRYLEDAESVLLRATRADTDDEVPSAEQLAAAGLTLREELQHARRNLEWAQASVRRETDRETVPGGQLLLGESAGGPRFYLNDEPIHAGHGLFLLTAAGWLPGRFEYTRTGEGEMVALFYFSLPGFGSAYGADVCVRLPQGARLALSVDIRNR